MKAIAMRCTKEQFEAVKPKLEKAGRIGQLLGAFKEFQYLTNDYNGKEDLVFDFISSGAIWRNEHQENIHETWNEKVFLEACGIETEQTYTLTKEMLLKLTDPIAKEWFPEAFDVELEVGKWYKVFANNSNYIINIKTIEGKMSIGYGLDIVSLDFYEDLRLHCNAYIWEEATPEEWQSALITEAEKKGFKEGVYIKDLLGFNSGTHKNGYDRNQCSDEDFSFGIHDDDEDVFLFIGNLMIFCNGKWAEIVETITKKEAEKLLNKKIV
jgi:hypothetical protein